MCKWISLSGWERGNVERIRAESQQGERVGTTPAPILARHDPPPQEALQEMVSLPQPIHWPTPHFDVVNGRQYSHHNVSFDDVVSGQRDPHISQHCQKTSNRTQDKKSDHCHRRIIYYRTNWNGLEVFRRRFEFFAPLFNPIAFTWLSYVIFINLLFYLSF